MGKPTGFLEVNRKTIPNRTPKERLKDWNEIHKHFEIERFKNKDHVVWTAGLLIATQA
jgi:glutamate synthase (NADPH/NADH) small chain